MIYKRIIWLVLIASIITKSPAQKGFYIPQRAKIFFNGNNATIFSNVINCGQLGVGKNAILNFKGIKWENDSRSIITDESDNGNGTQGEGGIVRFLSTGIASDPQLQWLTSGYNAAAHTGPVFSNLYISNPYGVSLTNASLKIRRKLHFTEGHIYTNGQILTVGDNDPGSITGYGENSFIVTSSSGGMLLREKITRSNGAVIFPIGVADGLYTPAAIRAGTDNPDDFYVRVFNGVIPNAGRTRLVNENGIDKTWQIGKLLRPQQENIEVTLLHLVEEEGQTFRSNRSRAYVSQYINGKWDEAPSIGTPLHTSLFTPGTISLKGGHNSRYIRSSITTESYFTKFAKELPNGGIDFRLWPNPTPEWFFISIGTNSIAPAYAIVIWDMPGQKIREERVNDRPVIEMGGLIPGTYIVGLISNIGKLIESRKLVITGY